ncbi:MAG: cell division protein FtsQ/DivIB [Vicinamibacterales bacterium]
MRPAGDLSMSGSGGSRAARIQRELAILVRSGRMPAFFVLAGGVLLLYGFLFSGDFLVGSVVVRGTSIGDPAEIVTTADAIGEPIFTIDASESAERVAVLPYVERVTVSTRFPDEVVITVVERAPAVQWQAGPRAFLVDERGHVLAEQQRGDLPLVVIEGDAPVVGGSVAPERVAAAVAVREALGERIDELTWTIAEGLVARLDDKRVVVFGAPERVPLKLAVYGEVARLAETWSVLDLREPDRPYYR